MVVSEAKLEANRRNAQKSTGPRTQEGKDRSKLNAVTHGLRANTLVLADEDPRELEARTEAWMASLLPRNEAERRAVEDAVVSSWRQDRARHAEVALADARLADHDADSNTTVKEQVIELGRRLFRDRLGPIEFYPTAIDDESPFREVSTSFAGAGKPDPDDPAILVLRLQSTLEGCEWMLGEWAKLKRSLDRGQAWVSSDKLRAVRLLGKQPIDAVGDEDGALVYLASFALNPVRSKWYWEISMELNDDDTRRFRQDVATRQFETLLMPADAAAAREALQALIARITEPLAASAEAYRESARIKAALAPDILAFDGSVEGERLRRHELASGRALARSIDTLLKLQRNPDAVICAPLSVLSSPPLSVVSSPLSIVGDQVDAVESTKLTNEPTSGSLSVVTSPLFVASQQVGAIESTNATNEPTVPCANVTNEPTVPCANVTNEPTVPCANVTNEPTVPCANVTNEPTVPCVNLTNEPTEPCANVTNEPTEPCANVTNDPTESCVNVTNEPTEGCVNVASEAKPASVGDMRIAGENGEDEGGEPAVSSDLGTTLPRVAAELTLDLDRDAIRRIRRTREEDVRKLNEHERRQARRITPDHLARRPEPEFKNGKPANRTGGQTASIGMTKNKGATARKTNNLEDILKTLVSLKSGTNHR